PRAAVGGWSQYARPCFGSLSRASAAPDPAVIRIARSIELSLGSGSDASQEAARQASSVALVVGERGVERGAVGDRRPPLALHRERAGAGAGGRGQPGIAVALI